MKRRFFILAVWPLLAASCFSFNTPDELAQMATGYAFARPKNKMNVTESVSVGQWDVPAGLDGPRKIVIDTELQQAHYFIAGRRASSSVSATTAPPYFATSGSTRLIDSSLPFTELTSALPL